MTLRSPTLLVLMMVVGVPALVLAAARYSGGADAVSLSGQDPTTDVAAPLVQQQVCLNPRINLSNAPHGSSTPQQFAIDGDRVYVVWAEAQGLTLRSSADGGMTFGAEVPVSTATNVAGVAASGPNVYVAWTSSNQGHLAVSHDYGATFGTPIVTSLVGPAFFGAAGVAVSGDSVYAFFTSGPGSPDAIHVRVSSDAGATFGSLVTLTTQAGFNSLKVFQSSGDDVYVLWENSNAGVQRVYFRRSSDRAQHSPRRSRLEWALRIPPWR